jgi:hypothetical protein
MNAYTVEIWPDRKVSPITFRLPAKTTNSDLYEDLRGMYKTLKGVFFFDDEHVMRALPADGDLVTNYFKDRIIHITLNTPVAAPVRPRARTPTRPRARTPTPDQPRAKTPTRSPLPQICEYSVTFKGTVTLPPAGTGIRSSFLYDDISKQIKQAAQTSPADVIVIQRESGDAVIVSNDRDVITIPTAKGSLISAVFEHHPAAARRPGGRKKARTPSRKPSSRRHRSRK